MDIQPFLIGGEWVQGTGSAFDSTNPANGKLNKRVAGASAADVDQAVRNAHRAQRDPKWRNTLPHERARLLHRVADLIVERGDLLANVQMRENGKLFSECRTQAAAAAGAFRYFAGIVETMVSEVAPSRGPHVANVIYEPFGVVAAITPWNSPLTLEAQKVAAAIAAGNAVVLKPSEFTPGPALELGRIFLDAGFPPGILNVVTGLGGETGLALVQHPDVRMISFTGGTATGRAIGRIAAERLVPVALELGGKSPHIVFADADLDAAVDGVVSGIFTSSGQSCIAGSRLFVEREIYDDFLARVVERTRALKVGLPDVAGSQIAPLSSFVHRERVESYVKSAREDGGTILIGGKRPDAPELQAGAFYEPTIIAGLTNAAKACRDEIFGPVLCVLPFDGEDDLVEQANGTTFGLGCGIWTESYKKAWRVARAIESGTVWINTYKELSVAVPFGGFKDSGVGREKGYYGIRVYQEPKTILWGMK
ncbi:aldehyde dehydrogenase [Paraburkholderia caribensis]|nr:aldehyde dehydrogenase [Paraburkholderia caribensis]